MTGTRLFVLGVLAIGLGVLALGAASPAFAAEVNVLPLSVENHASPVGSTVGLSSGGGIRVAPSLAVTGTLPVSGTMPVTGTVKIATAIAKYFSSTLSTTVESVMTLRQAGYGFGEIVKAYALAEANGMDVDEILALREQDQGWGYIVKSQVISKWNTSLGKVIQSSKTMTGTVPGTMSNKKGEQQNQGTGNSGKGVGPTKPTVGQPNLGTGLDNPMNSGAKGNSGKGRRK